ncbi:MAG: radical SAM protein [Planctomycetes bacterium]|nr:radical SAM protein [Planctomycetota bacterium]
MKLSVDIHSYCNGRCTICPYPKYARRQSQGYMDLSLYERIVQEAGEIGRENNFRPLMSYCCMGEPFLVDDLSGYTSLAEQAGIDLSLNTNAAAMTKEKVDALLGSGFTGKIHISFHGISPEVYQRIMGLEYDVALRHIHYLLDRYPHERICVRGVDDRWPEGEKQRWFDYWRYYGVELEYLRPISRCGSVDRLLPGKLRNPEKIRLYGCRYHHPLVEMVILFDGRAVMCCQDMGREVIWGDVYRDGILGVWNSENRRKVVEQLYSGEPSGKDFLCSRCEQALGKAGIVYALVEASWRKATRRRAGFKQLEKSTDMISTVLK